jgi:hypothetical protein
MRNFCPQSRRTDSNRYKLRDLIGEGAARRLRDLVAEPDFSGSDDLDPHETSQVPLPEA